MARQHVDDAGTDASSGPHGLILAAALLAVTGYHPSSSASQASTPTSPGSAAGATTITPPTTIDARADVLRGWRAFWADLVQVSRTGDAQSPQLAAHATGPALAQLRSQFQQLRDNGWVTQGDVRLRRPQVVQIVGTTAKVRDCVDATRFIRVDARTHRRVDQPGGRPDDETATLVLQAGAWKVQQTAVIGKCAS